MEGWQERFLRRIADNPNVTAAARAAGITRGRAYQLKDEDPEFAAAWKQAHQSAVDALEQAAWKRAQKQSDQLMMMLLKAHRPEVYREIPKGANVTPDGDGGWSVTLSWGDGGQNEG